MLNTFVHVAPDGHKAHEVGGAGLLTGHVTCTAFVSFCHRVPRWSLTIRSF